MFISLLAVKIYGQCSLTISSFPYIEDFETSASWTEGGTNSDWTWGSPSHPLISNAAAGLNCWCIGGLSGSSYNGNQESFLMSPCFDFTSLDNPWISFSVFWETEFAWDGATLQYSTDEGNSWFNVGAYNDPVDCMNDNWFNHSDVNWLTDANPKHGWSGRVGPTSGSCGGGSGSGQWLEASHCLNNLANASSVRFRFLFGSGNTCNSYDGFAVDNITIRNATANTVDFTYSCLENNEISFSNQSDNCTIGFQWNFNDPDSGSQTNSSLENPNHSFSQGGTFDVSLTATGVCNQSTSITKTIIVLSPQISKSDISCFGADDGSATANGLISSTYSWNTNPVQTSQTISNLSSGIYSVTITDPNACPVTTSVSIDEPVVLALAITSSPTCINSCTGSLNSNASGGTAPYTYSWNSLSGGQTISASVCEGTYTGNVSDANGCTASNTAVVSSNPLPVISCNPANICIGSTATLNASGAQTYTWFPAEGLNVIVGPTVIANPSQTTEYTITGTSAQGCTSSTTVMVNVSAVFAPQANFIFTPAIPDIFNNQLSFTNLSEEASAYQWDFYGDFQTNESNPVFTFPNEESGTYLVCLTALNNQDCSNQVCKSILIQGIPSVFVPNAFSPNNDLNNNYFFPVARDIKPESYRLTVYNRWGENIFSTNDLLDKWDGTYKGEDCPAGVYTWTLFYKEENSDIEIMLDGSVLLKR